MNDSSASILDNRRASYDQAIINGTVGAILPVVGASLLKTAGANLDRFEKVSRRWFRHCLVQVPATG